MKLLSYALDQRMEPRLAISIRGQAVDVMRAALWMKEERGAKDFLTLPTSMKLALEDWGKSRALLGELENTFQNMEFESLTIYKRPVSLPESDIFFFAPMPDPPSLRLFNAFSSDTPEIFLFGNTQTLVGHQQHIAHPGLHVLPEMGAIVGGHKGGGETLIAGYCVVNNLIDLSVNVQSGLAWGVATGMGPHFVTADELESHKMGSGFNLDTQVTVGTDSVAGRFKDMAFRFEDMLRAAGPTKPLPGDILCSGSPLAHKRVPVLGKATSCSVEIQALGVLMLSA